jgi:hypothetical protein
MGRGLYVTTLLPPVEIAARPSKSAFTTFADAYGAPQKILPKSLMDPTLALDLEAWGSYSSLTGAALTLGFGFGGAALAAPTTILAQSTSFTTGTTPTLWPFHLRWMGTLQRADTGAAGGQWDGEGFCELGSSLIAWTSTPMPTTDALRTVTCDVTADASLSVCASYGASSASNLVIVRKFYAKVMS